MEMTRKSHTETGRLKIVRNDLFKNRLEEGMFAILRQSMNPLILGPNKPCIIIAGVLQNLGK